MLKGFFDRMLAKQRGEVVASGRGSQIQTRGIRKLVAI